MKRRILDFGVARPGSSQDWELTRLLWPADAFRVTFPVRADAATETNVFERLILSLLTEGATRSIESLEKETCLDGDFVQTVVRQLQDKGFVDNALHPDSEVLKEFGIGTGSEQSPETFVTAVVFRERLGGMLLPHVHVLSDSTPLRNMDNPGKESVDLSEWASETESKPPVADEIRVLLRSERSVLRANGTMPFHLDGGLVRVEGKPEAVLLPCRLVFDETGRPAVTNPFRSGYSAELGDILSRRRLDTPALNSRMKSAEDPLSRIGRGDETQSEKDRVSDETRHRYPRLADAIRRRYLSADNVYDALEWALFYASRQSPVDDSLFLLETAFRQVEEPDKFLDAATRLGFSIKRSDGKPIRFAPVVPGKLLDYRQGKADMGTVIALSLLQAETHPEEAAFARVARDFPDFFLRLQHLRDMRNEQRHGAKEGATNEDSAEWPWFLSVIHLLLPDADIRGVNTNPTAIARERDSRIAHRMRLQSLFGYNAFSRLSETQIANLVMASRNAAVKGADMDRQPFATGMCAALESLLSGRMQDADFRERVVPDSFEIDLAKRSEMLHLSAVLGRPCFHLNARNRKAASEGKPTTLGGCVLALVAFEDEAILSLLFNRSLGWTDAIAALLDARSHGNEAVRFPDDQFDSLNNQSFSLFQTLLETLPCH